MATGGETARNEKLKKQEVLKEINQLQIKIQALEREKSTHLYGKANDFRQDFCQLQELDQKLEADLKTEKAKMIQQLNKIRNMVKKFHRELKDVRPTPEFVEKLKVIMEEIEKHITDFKEEQKRHYEELMRDERTASLEVATLEKRFESWAQKKPATSRNTHMIPSSHRETSRDLPPEVVALERFLQQTGGMRGGWDEYDHGTFLRFRNRHKGRIAFLDELIPALPTKTEIEIRQHEQWYQQYLALNDSKKEAIEKWRERKEIEKEEKLAQVDSSSEDEEERKFKEEKQKITEKERQEKKMQLNRWKVERELEKAEKEEQRLRQQRLKEKEKERKKERQLLAKVKVEEFKKTREEQKEQERLEKELQEMMETEERRRQAAVHADRFKQRDLYILEKKLSKEKAQQEKEMEKQKQLERIKQRVEAGVQRDPNRLVKLTEGWKERKKVAGPSGTGQVLHMPHRAVPSWRQGIH